MHFSKCKFCLREELDLPVVAMIEWDVEGQGHRGDERQDVGPCGGVGCRAGRGGSLRCSGVLCMLDISHNEK